ncbi:MAG: NAD(P)-binding domain-containing protein, partial [Streptosporangiaceae bacterium]
MSSAAGPAGGPARAAGPVGFVGLGNMGRRMAANLANAGFGLVLRDADPAAEGRFIAAHGGTAAASPAAFGDTLVVVTML